MSDGRAADGASERDGEAPGSAGRGRGARRGGRGGRGRGGRGRKRRADGQTRGDGGAVRERRDASGAGAAATTSSNGASPTNGAATSAPNGTNATPGAKRPGSGSGTKGARGATNATSRQAPRGAPPRARREVSAGGVVYRVASTDDGGIETFFLLIRDSYRNWGFPKGHLERGELPDAAALREVAEETGLDGVALRGVIETIDWYFRFRGRLIHKVCHFYLMETERSETSPQVAEGITACRWAPFEEAVRLVSYANAREVLKRAHAMVCDAAPARPDVAAPPGASRVGGA